ncbi:S-locus glycoprotein domain-containing protein [Artemisia annua]|uniref:non-specific serine/threonine protein kinase n=1 Tax=Artemisia annua TaxID=35608 RepID=A0A2U1NQN6_ARTAN|nr:S-locus glycoprotein domain-containing protein [Artemisia annua]
MNLHMYGYKAKNHSDFSFGCEPKFDLTLPQVSTDARRRAWMTPSVRLFSGDIKEMRATLNVYSRICCSMAFTWVLNTALILRYLKLMHYHMIKVVATQKPSGVTTQNYLAIATGFRRFSYDEILKASHKFREEIGRGGGGIVYKGILPDNRVVAIKRLHEAIQGESEFLAEISTIGRINHKNLIETYGYCAQGKHRILVYEYMENGSLAGKLGDNQLDWLKRFEIAIGVAKGLAYLHEECLEWVDVYSYGMVVLEMITGRSSTCDQPNDGNERVDQKRLVSWVREKVQKARESCTAMQLMEILDPVILMAENDEEHMKNLLHVVLQCVEEDRDDQP